MFARWTAFALGLDLQENRWSSTSPLLLIPPRGRNKFSRRHADLLSLLFHVAVNNVGFPISGSPPSASRVVKVSLAIGNKLFQIYGGDWLLLGWGPTLLHRRGRCFFLCLKVCGLGNSNTLWLPNSSKRLVPTPLVIKCFHTTPWFPLSGSSFTTGAGTGTGTNMGTGTDMGTGMGMGVGMGMGTGMGMGRCRRVW